MSTAEIKTYREPDLLKAAELIKGAGKVVSRRGA
jgi:hypothetical protein